MKATQYLLEQVLRKRPYIDPAWFAPILASPVRREAQADGRIRVWGAIVDPRDGKTRFLRIVTLEDGETIHNAFFDRDFEDKSQ
jgi:hypothetical protein